MKNAKEINNDLKIGKTDKPFWEKIIKMSDSIPEKEARKLPEDLAENFEEYMYGSFEK